MGIFSLLRIVTRRSRTHRKLTVGLLHFPSTKINLTTSRVCSFSHTHTPSKYWQPNLGPCANKVPYHEATPIPIFLNCLVFWDRTPLTCLNWPWTHPIVLAWLQSAILLSQPPSHCHLISQGINSVNSRYRPHLHFALSCIPSKGELALLKTRE